MASNLQPWKVAGRRGVAGGLGDAGGVLAWRLAVVTFKQTTIAFEPATQF